MLPTDAKPEFTKTKTSEINEVTFHPTASATHQKNHKAHSYAV